MVRGFLFVGVTFLLAACGSLELGASAPATFPVPTPFPEIATTPSFQAWTTSRILAFRESMGSTPERPYIGLGLQILARPAALDAVAAGELELVVSASEPPAGWFVTPLGWERVVFAVHPGNPVRALSLQELASIFRGQTVNWDALGGPDLAIQPVIPLEGDELRDHLAGRLLEGRRFTTLALLGPSPEATLAWVGQDPGAIGILPLSTANDRVALIQVEGIEARDREGRYPLEMEVLAFAPQEPGGVVREWLAWLQAEGALLSSAEGALLSEGEGE